MNASKKQLWWIGLVLFAALAAASIPARAGDHWFSRNTETKPAPRALYSRSNVVKATAGSSVTFDIVVSLYTNRTTVAERAPYEAIFNYFAQALYEESNGAHKLGTVRIYTKGKHASSSDILWTERGWPCADAAGYGTSGKHIYFFDVFQDGHGTGSDLNFLGAGEAEGGGYTLGHEWGHYTYGLFDEYRGDIEYRTNNWITMPWDTDTPVTNAVMDSQWNAKGGHYAWLNYSTPLDDTHNTAQFRAYGASCWEVLARSTADDPRTGARVNLPTRTYWPYLGTFAPGSNEWPSIELPAGIATATNALKIIWMSDDVAMQIVIDASGSMDSDNKLLYAENAAKTLVDIVPLPDSNSPPTVAIGVIAFDDTVSVEQPLTLIDSQATKDSIKAVIDAIYKDGMTAIYDAAQTALDGLLGYSSTGGTDDMGKVTFLLTDGQDNSSAISLDDLIANYQAAKVPIFTFGFGSDVDDVTLGYMSSETGGRYYFSPASQADIQRAFLDANQVATDIQGLTSGTPSVAPGATVTSTFSVDNTAATLTIIVTHDGGTNDFDLVLIEPDGSTTHAPSSCDNSAGTTTLCTFTVQAPTTGTWTLRSKSNLGSTSSLSFNVQTSSKPLVTYSLSIASLGGAAVQYPQPIALIATLSRGLPIAGANVSAFVTLPDGSTQTVAFADNGVPPDARANDGVYSALYIPTQNGTYRFTVSANNAAGTALLTYSSTQPSVNQAGDSRPPADSAPITEDFQRQANLQIQVSGVQYDDHGNDAGSATVLPPTNTNIVGRIDYSGDVDFFEVDMPTVTSSVVVRVSNLASGIQPLLKIYGSDGTTLLGQGDLTNAVSPAGYIVLQVDHVAGATLYAAVSSTTTGGTYEISAGPAVASDAAPQQTFNICLHDDRTHSFLQIDSGTGDYKFTSCTDAFTLSGTGIISIKKAVLKLTDKKTDRKLTASLNQTKYKGTMSLSAVIQTTPKKKSKTYKISDKITTNNTCTCP
ncbi:MAG: VWA domain-containing protein [Verrucomicrobiia bacterium]